MYNPNIPTHLPHKLTISLWDFCWYTMTQPGEPFHDLDQAFADTVERGYNTIRICAMPMFLFTADGPRGGKLRISNLGQNQGHRTRWMNNKGGAEIDGLQHLHRLFECADKYGVYVILSSWEYQQSPAFLDKPDIFKELMAIEPKRRFDALADAMSQLVAYLKEHGFSKRIAYAELHNEVEYGKLTDVVSSETGNDEPAVTINEQTYAEMKPHMERAVNLFRSKHPDILFTIGYSLARPKIGYWKHIVENMQVAHFHLYNDGVLRALYDAVFQEPFPNALAKSMISSDAPPYEDYKFHEDSRWRFEVFPVKTSNFYLFDWCDPVKWDLWLYEHYANYKESMRLAISHKFDMYEEWSKARNLPMVIGEGYVGYTPADTNFEEGPVGKDIAEFAIHKALEKGFWGMVLSSVAAPHHRFWQDIEWQKAMNEKILSY